MMKKREKRERKLYYIKSARAPAHYFRTLSDRQRKTDYDDAKKMFCQSGHGVPCVCIAWGLLLMMLFMLGLSCGPNHGVSVVSSCPSDYEVSGAFSGFPGCSDNGGNAVSSWPPDYAMDRVFVPLSDHGMSGFLALRLGGLVFPALALLALLLSFVWRDQRKEAFVTICFAGQAAAGAKDEKTGVVDSGATDHMTWSRDLFAVLFDDFVTLNVADRALSVRAQRGRFKPNALGLKYGLWHPELQTTLISVPTLEKEGYTTIFKTGKNMILDPSGGGAPAHMFKAALLCCSWLWRSGRAPGW